MADLANQPSTVIEPSPLVDFIAGTVGGIASLLAGHPFDTIKTRLQAQSHHPRSHAQTSATSPLIGNAAQSYPRYVNAIDAFRRIVAQERFVGLYKGVTSPMLGVAAMNASVFGVYGIALRSLSSSTSAAGSQSNATLANIFLAGCASGVVSAVITSPIDLIKIRQQLSFDPTTTSNMNKQPSTWRVVRAIWKRGGVRGLYRGFGCTCLRDLGYGPYFLSYEVMNRFMLTLHGVGAYDDGIDVNTRRVQLSNIELALSGGLAGVIAWLSTFAIDVVKTRVQASDALPGQRSAFIAAARSTYAQAGWRSFFAGVGPTMLRALPVNAVLFLTFEATKDFLMRLGY